MSLPDDVWNIIAQDCDYTTLIMLKSVNKQLHKLLTVSTKGIYYDLCEIIYNDYYSLFVNYLERDFNPNTVDTSDNRKKMYFACGLGGSHDFFKWLTSKFKQDIDSLLYGAFRSCNKEFVDIVYCEPLHSKISQRYMRLVFESQSVDMITYVLSKHIEPPHKVYTLSLVGALYSKGELKYGREFRKSKLRNISAYSKYPAELELSLGFYKQLDYSYIDYILEENYIGPDVLAYECINYEINDALNIIKYLESKGYDFIDKLGGKSLLAATCIHGDMEVFRYIVTKYPNLVKDEFITGSIEIFDCLTNEYGVKIHVRDSIYEALEAENIEFIHHLSSKGVKCDNDELIVECLLNKHTMLDGIISAGYRLPPHIWHMLEDEDDYIEDISVYLLQRMDAHGCIWDDIAFKYLMKYDKLELLQYAMNQGVNVPDNVINDLVINGFVDRLDWFVNNGYKYDDDILDITIEHLSADGIKKVINALKLRVTKNTIVTLSMRNDVDDKSLIMNLLVDIYTEQLL